MDPAHVGDYVLKDSKVYKIISLSKDRQYIDKVERKSLLAGWLIRLWALFYNDPKGKVRLFKFIFIRLE